MIELIATKHNGRLTLPPAQLQLLNHFTGKVAEGKAVRITYSEVGRAKTQSQLGAIFGLALAQIVAEFEDRGYDATFIYGENVPDGTRVTVDMLKQFFYARYPKFDENGRQITLSRADTKYASEIFDNVRNYAASQWGICIPEPRKDWKENN